MLLNKNETDAKAVNKRLLQFFVPINALTEDHLHSLLRDTQVEYLYEGQTLFESHSYHQHIYLLHGQLELTDSQGQTRVLSAEDAENLTSITQNQPKPMKAVALSDCSVIRFATSSLDNMLCWDQAASYITLDISSAREMDADADWMLTLLKSNLFYKISPMNIRAVLNCFQPMQVKAGEVIVRQGQIGDALYVIKEGEAEVLRADSPQSASTHVADIQMGRCFGEDALVNEALRNATVKMKTDGSLMRLDKQDFFKLVKKPDVDTSSLPLAIEAVANGAQWLDVRTLGEYELGHIPGALHGQMDLLKLQLRRLDNPNGYIAYSNTAVRAEAATHLLCKDGIAVKALSVGLDELSCAERERLSLPFE